MKSAILLIIIERKNKYIVVEAEVNAKVMVLIAGYNLGTPALKPYNLKSV